MHKEAFLLSMPNFLGKSKMSFYSSVETLACVHSSAHRVKKWQNKDKQKGIPSS